MGQMAEPRVDGQAAGVALVLVSTIAFAIGPTAARLALENGSNTLTVVTLRGVIGAALMALLVPLARQGFAIDRSALRWCLCCGVFYSVTIYSFIGSVAYLPVSIAVLVFFTHPILVAVIDHFRGGDRLTVRKLLLTIAALVGLGVVLGAELATLDPAGLALAMLAAAAMCGMILSSAVAQEHASSTQVNLYATAASTLAFGLLTTALGAWNLPVNTVGWLGIAGAGVGIGIGLLTFFAALRRLSPVRATMLSNIEPLISILFAAAVLGERLDPHRWAGVALVIAALVLFEVADRRTAHVDP